MTKDTTEISRAPPMGHHGYKMARRVSDTYEICNCFILSFYTNVLIYRNIHFSKIYLRTLKLQQKFTLFWIFPRTCTNIAIVVESDVSNKNLPINMMLHTSLLKSISSVYMSK